jgi:uncharacterized protein (TIGR03000 family)
MRKVWLSLVASAAALLLGTAPAEAAIHSRHMRGFFPSEMARFNRGMFNPFTRRGFARDAAISSLARGVVGSAFARGAGVGFARGAALSSLAGRLPTQMSFGGFGMGGAPFAPMMYPMPFYGGYGLYPMPFYPPGRYPPATAPEETSRSMKTPTESFEVSGSLDTPPPHRAIIRVRLPRTWADVSIDGQKIDSVGKSRTYVTPELSQARTFEVTVTWKDKGQTTSHKDKVTVAAGQIGTVDFTARR